MTPIVQAGAIAVVALGTGGAALTAMNDEIPDMPVPDMAWEIGSALDGMTFAIDVVLDQSDSDQSDVLRFADGMFLSVDCEEHCAFGYTAYFTYTDGDTIHFTTSPVCEDAPHNTVWYGTVTDGVIEVEMSWTTRRWYWTHQITGHGSGALEPTIDMATTG